jgi:hypothetical protein
VTERDRQSGTMSLRRKTGTICNVAEQMDRCQATLMSKYTNRCSCPDSQLNRDLIENGIHNIVGSKRAKCDRLAIHMVKSGQWK